MADVKAVAVFESVYRRTDQQIRDILATYTPDAEVDTINVILGDGVSVMVPGVGAAIRVDFRSRITGVFLQEFDGTSGGVEIRIEKAAAGPSPTWTRITPFVGPAITGGRYFADDDLGNWVNTSLERGDMLRYWVVSATTMMRVHVALRIRRLEP